MARARVAALCGAPLTRLPKDSSLQKGQTHPGCACTTVCGKAGTKKKRWTSVHLFFCAMVAGTLRHMADLSGRRDGRVHVWVEPLDLVEQVHHLTGLGGRGGGEADIVRVGRKLHPYRCRVVPLGAVL